MWIRKDWAFDFCFSDGLVNVILIKLQVDSYRASMNSTANFRISRGKM